MERRLASKPLDWGDFKFVRNRLPVERVASGIPFAANNNCSFIACHYERAPGLGEKDNRTKSLQREKKKVGNFGFKNIRSDGWGGGQSCGQPSVPPIFVDSERWRCTEHHLVNIFLASGPP